jgi:hypothetical protein
MSQALQSPTVPFEVVVHDLPAALDRAAAASLAGGIIASSGQPYTAEQAIEVQREVLRYNRRSLPKNVQMTRKKWNLLSLDDVL